MKNWSNSFLTKSLTDRGLKKRPIKWDFPWYSAWSYRHADNPHTGTHWHQEQKFWILSFHQLHAILKIKYFLFRYLLLLIIIIQFFVGQTHSGNSQKNSQQIVRVINEKNCCVLCVCELAGRSWFYKVLNRGHTHSPGSQHDLLLCVQIYWSSLWTVSHSSNTANLHPLFSAFEIG